MTTDESGVAEEKLVALASELLEKWSGLKEVFRIPKRAQPVRLPYKDNVYAHHSLSLSLSLSLIHAQLKKPPLEPEEREGDDERKGSEPEGRRGEGGERDRRGRLRGNPSPESSPTW